MKLKMQPETWSPTSKEKEKRNEAYGPGAQKVNTKKRKNRKWHCNLRPGGKQEHKKKDMGLGPKKQRQRKKHKKYDGIAT